MTLVGAAFEVALNAHAGQTDKLGEAYIAHVVRVAARLETETERCVALLHDVLEDTSTTAEEIADRFGDEIATAVQVMTKDASAGYEDYLKAVAAHPLARRVKCADLADNSDPARLGRLDEATRTRLDAKYAKARSVLGLTKDDLSC